MRQEAALGDAPWLGHRRLPGEARGGPVGAWVVQVRALLGTVFGIVTQHAREEPDPSGRGWRGGARRHRALPRCHYYGWISSQLGSLY